MQTATPEACLIDTIEGCLSLIGRGAVRPDDYQYFKNGINAIQGHLFHGGINGENAGILASEVMYLASCILTGSKEYQRVTDPAAYSNESFSLKGFKRVRYLRTISPTGYAYLIKALHQLQENGYFTESLL